MPHAARHHDITGATKYDGFPNDDFIVFNFCSNASLYRDMPRIAWPVQTATSLPISKPSFQATSKRTEVFSEAAGLHYSSTVERLQFSTSGNCGELTDAINHSPGSESFRCKKRRRTTYVLSSGLVIEVEPTGSHGVTKPLDVVISDVGFKFSMNDRGVADPLNIYAIDYSDG